MTINQDAVAEVKVLRNNYGAEYGNNGGAIINIVSKGGGKDYAGSVYYFLRNESLNATPFFNNKAGLKRPLYRHIYPGGNVQWSDAAAAIWRRRRLLAERQSVLLLLVREATPDHAAGSTLRHNADRAGTRRRFLAVDQFANAQSVRSRSAHPGRQLQRDGQERLLPRSLARDCVQPAGLEYHSQRAIQFERTSIAQLLSASEHPWRSPAAVLSITWSRVRLTCRSAAWSSALISGRRTTTAFIGRLNGGLRTTTARELPAGRETTTIVGESAPTIFTRTMVGQPTGFASSARTSSMSSTSACDTTPKASFPPMAKSNDCSEAR